MKLHSTTTNANGTELASSVYDLDEDETLQDAAEDAADNLDGAEAGTKVVLILSED